MKRTPKRPGFVFIFMLMVVMLATVIMFTLAHISNNMIFTSDNAYMTAATANLTASAAAWARRNAADPQFHNTDIAIDPNDLGYHSAALTMHATPADDNVTVEISASCSKRRRTRRAAEQLTLPAAPPAVQESPQS